jgi:RNA polymerase sigma-70 factor, ECF subfamily
MKRILSPAIMRGPHRSDTAVEARMSSPPDGQLIRQVLAGARARYSVLVERYQERLYRYALGMVSEPRLARGLVEDACVDAYATLRECGPNGRFDIWVFRLLRGRCRDHLRKGGFPEAPRPEDEENEQNLRPSSLQEAVDLLPDPDVREAFLLKHVEGLDYEEIAELLDVPVEAVRGKVRGARERLFMAGG